MSQFYNIITSNGSRNSASGYGKISLVFMDENEIIGIATQRANHRGHELQYSKGNEGEALDAAIEERTHDGYLYEIFKCGEQDAEFIARAADFGLKAEAEAFIE